MVDLKVRHEDSLRLLEQLTELLETDSHLDKLPRILLLYSNKVANEDEFVRYLYTQETLDSPPSQLKEIFPYSTERVEHGFEVACKKDHMRQLVAALEKSGNCHVISKNLKRLGTLINNNDTEAILESSDASTLEEDVTSATLEQPEDTLFNGNQKLFKFFFWPSGPNGKQNSIDEQDSIPVTADHSYTNESHAETQETVGYDEDFLASLESQIVISNDTDDQSSLRTEDDIQGGGAIEEPIMQGVSRLRLFCTAAPPAEANALDEDEEINDDANENENDSTECAEDTVVDGNTDVPDDNQEAENTEEGEASSEEQNYGIVGSISDEINNEDEDS